MAHLTCFTDELRMLPTRGHTMNGLSLTNGIDASGFPMKLYKYRKLEPFEYIADILCANRFHTAHFSDLTESSKSKDTIPLATAISHGA